jgi:hypothetical protein
MTPKKHAGHPLEITTLITMSTSHITADDNTRLLAGEEPPVGSWYSLGTDGNGHLVHCSPDTPTHLDNGVCLEEGWSPAVTALQVFAEGHGCEYIRLDPDGPVIPGLPVYDW